MNKSFKILKRSSGFSLVEMMVVVAIIGVMATIAVPNMTLMTIKARQSEAKAQLAFIYATEQSFYGEFGFYTYCLYEVGYVPDNPVRFYTTGFANGRGCGAGLGCTYNAKPDSCSFTAIAWSGSSRNSATFNMNRWANPALQGWGVAGNYDVPADGTFKGVAYGSISPRASFMDVWSIDNNKTMTNEQPGF